MSWLLTRSHGVEVVPGARECSHHIEEILALFLSYSLSATTNLVGRSLVSRRQHNKLDPARDMFKLL